ncbi:hypothetical protein V5636_004845 [Escherichia coli]|uniref:hypothetical protein n=1 Tax=Escherichia coli TaxID=562 RepID=UPI000F9C59EC|nr:hypothetical protein [Escherichia coli]EED0783980.1 hypothetical protein [Escherichia coli]EGE7864560.1 hypothetical protein [Escherichia coli]EKF4002257.1 hypothetical protein [Escherichia coli]ELR6150438.1 hypothetical protein [Escherichia coli]MCM4818436.1 hypothetical protein [Escherichia coli]
MTLFFCKEMPPYKDVEQKTTTIIIFLILTALKTTSYHHGDDDDKITKMRLFPRPPAPCSGPPHQEDPQNDNGYHLQQNPVSSTIAPDWRL